jgi:hypothetical protein
MERLLNLNMISYVCSTDPPLDRLHLSTRVVLASDHPPRPQTELQAQMLCGTGISTNPMAIFASSFDDFL